VKAPDDKAIAFTFGSYPEKDPAKRWRAKLSFPPGATAETVLPIEVVDGNDAPVADGVFEFAGRRLPVRDGAASISYADFIKGKHAVELWLHRPGLPSVYGGLSFA
jgi:hypothetical protein